MRILCQAKDIGVDGTFKITPKPWRQVMIVSAQVREGIWVPVAFGYLPDKQLDSYTTFFNLLNTAISSYGYVSYIFLKKIVNRFETGLKL